jgi:hypothetical protein
MTDPLRPKKPAAEELVLVGGTYMTRREAAEIARASLVDTAILLVRTAALLLSRIEG